jgi:RNase P protein component
VSTSAPAAVVTPATRLRYPAARRLRDSASFAAFASSGRAVAVGRWWRGSRRWVSVAALINDAQAATNAAHPPCRFGVTVGKRNAARSIDRSLIKRVLREAARRAAPALDAAAATQALQLDVVLRLKAPVPAPATLARVQLKRELRAEADALLARLLHSMPSLVSSQPSPPPPSTPSSAP